MAAMLRWLKHAREERVTQGVADSSLLLADKGLHDQDQVKAIRAYAKGLFAEIAVRIVAFVVDLILVLFLMVLLSDHLLQWFHVDDRFQTAASATILVAYFALFWVSPIRATPTQWLFQMRVLHESGAPLSLREALIRGVSLVALWGFALFVLNRFFVEPGVWLIIVGVALLLYVPSVTARRQGLHDFLAHSVVVNKRSLRSDAAEQDMYDFLKDPDPAIRRSSRPSVYKMIIDAIVLAIPIYLVTMGIEMAHFKNMYARTAYALGEARQMQTMVSAAYAMTGEWPSTQEELGRPLRHNYPAGGYYQLEEDGVIRIQFEVLPELKSGSLLLEPRIEDGEVIYQCRAIGDMERRYVPRFCRD